MLQIDGYVKTKCVRLDNFEEVKSGAYVCQCPLNGSILSKDKRKTEEFRENLNELIIGHSYNSTNSLDPLSLVELDEKLSDKSFVAKQLFLQQQKLSKQRSSIKKSIKLSQNNNNNNNNGKGIENKQQKLWENKLINTYFALGVQLDADATLLWFAFGKTKNKDNNNYLNKRWPELVCRYCKQQEAFLNHSGAHDQRPSISYGDHQVSLDGEFKFNNQINNISFDSFKENSQQQQQFETLNTCNEFPEESSLNNLIRIIITTLQTFCAIVTTLLIAILFKVRKSRVSVFI